MRALEEIESGSRRPLRAVGWVATRLGVSRWQVYEMVKRGSLPHVKLGRLVRFDEDAIEAFIRDGGTGADERAAPNAGLRLSRR